MNKALHISIYFYILNFAHIFTEVQHPNPMGFQQPNLARWLLILQIVIGILLLSLSVWIFFLTPNTPVQDNPYWCGLVVSSSERNEHININL